MPGFCKSATLAEVAEHGYVLTPGRYVGAPEAEEDAEPFDEKMERLTAELAEQMAEGQRLDAEIRRNLESSAMGSRASLNSLCEFVVDCPHSTPVWTVSGETVLRSKNIRNGRLDLSERSFTDGAGFQSRIKRAKPTGGDIVITREAPMGECAMIPDGLECCLGQRMVLLRPDRRHVDPRYLLYALQSPAVQWQIGAHDGTGSTVSNVRIPALEGLEIPTPSLDEQRRIASILGALDDKIELNRRMSRTLDEMAKAIFKSWFIDPVENGVPDGWQLSTVGEGFQLVMGQSPPGSTYNTDGHGLPFYQGRADFGFRTPRRRVYCTAPSRRGRPGDTLVSVRAPVGDVNVAAEPCAIGRGVAAVRHRSGATSFTFHQMGSLRLAFSHFDAEGTVFGSIGRVGFEQLPIVAPPRHALTAFESTVGPMDARIMQCERQNATLNVLRDRLLPRLMSGELRA